jgi:hypothetical protein
MRWCEKKLSFCMCVLFILILSFGVELFPVFTNFIDENRYVDKFNKTIHRYDVLSNILSVNLGKFGLGESIIKEVLFLIILLTLNCYILYKLIQIGRRKKRLTSNSLNVQNSTRAGNRKIIMILFLFLTFLLGHLPNFLFFVFSDGYYSNSFWVDFKDYGTIFFYFSFSTSFFVYFAFNNIFKRFFLRIIPF